MTQLTERLDRFEDRLHSMERELAELRRLARTEARDQDDTDTGSRARAADLGDVRAGSRRARAARTRRSPAPDGTRPRDCPRDRSVTATARAARPERAARCTCARVDRRHRDAARRHLLLRARGRPRLDRSDGARHPRRSRVGRARRRGCLAAPKLRRHVRIRLGGGSRHRRLLRNAPCRRGALRPDPGAARIDRSGRDRSGRCRSRTRLEVGDARIARARRRDARPGSGRAAGRPHRNRHDVRLPRARRGDSRGGAPQLARSARCVGRRYRAAGDRTRCRQARARASRRDRILARLRRRPPVARAAQAGSRTCRRAC